LPLGQVLRTDAPWLGRQWCFFIGVPVALVAPAVLQRTLKLAVVPRVDVKIDYAGAALIAASVSALLAWVSFVDGSFAWLSWQTGAMVGAGLLLLAVAVRSSRGPPSRSFR
jgi:hypothetical protein